MLKACIVMTGIAIFSPPYNLVSGGQYGMVGARKHHGVACLM